MHLQEVFVKIFGTAASIFFQLAAAFFIILQEYLANRFLAILSGLEVVPNPTPLQQLRPWFLQIVFLINMD